MDEDDVDPTSYPIKFEDSTELGRKRKQSTSSDECDYASSSGATPVKKAKSQWTNDAKTALLRCRLHLNPIFENNNEAVAKRAWEKIADMLDMPCTGEDCVEMFHHLAKTYLRKQKLVFQGVQTDSAEWGQFQTIEELFLISPKLSKVYESVDLNTSEEEQDPTEFDDESEPLDEEKLPNETFSVDLSDFADSIQKFRLYMKSSKHKQKLRDNKVTKIIQSLVKMREEHMQLLTVCLKRIFFRFAELDLVAQRESLEALASIFPGIYSTSSVAVSIIGNYLKSSSVHHETIKATTMLLMNFTGLLKHLANTPDEEEEFYLRSLPSSSEYFCPWAEVQLRHLQPPILSEFNFKGHLNVSRSTVEELVLMIGYCKSLRPDPLSTNVSVQRQMVLFMWYLTHDETYEQLALRFSVLSTEVPIIIKDFVSILTEELAYISWPDKEDSKAATVREFESIAEDAFPGVIGAMGTKYFSTKITAWYIDENGDVQKMNNLNQDIALLCICDAKYFFTLAHLGWLEIPSVKSEHLKPADEMKKVVRVPISEVFYRSPFHIAAMKKVKGNLLVEKFGLPDNLHVVADSTFPIMTSTMVPFGDQGEPTPQQLRFNELLHKSRAAIDVAFGKLLGRLPRLKTMDPLLQQSPGLILACLAIHNFCVKQRDDFEADPIQMPERPVSHARNEEAAYTKRNRICGEINQGAIKYVYRTSGSVKTSTDATSSVI